MYYSISWDLDDQQSATITRNTPETPAMGDKTTSVKVAVRLRPFNHNEKESDSKLIIKIHPTQHQCTIVNPNKEDDEKSFTYDFLYDSFLPPEDPNHASQDTVWNDLGNELLEAAWSGYNYSLFAYGQTGSGKSHSMVGFGEQRGIIPRACEAIFEKIKECENEAAIAQLSNEKNQSGKTSPDTSYKIEVSMLEIYNERVRDLFVPLSTQDRGGLKVRDSPKTGAYVEVRDAPYCIRRAARMFLVFYRKVEQAGEQ